MKPSRLSGRTVIQMAEIEIFRARNTTGLAINNIRVTKTKPYGLIQSMQKYVVDDKAIIEAIGATVQPIKRGKWITKAEDYYKAWQDSGRSWDDMPYFVTGLKFACSNCFEQFDVNAEGVEKWNGCPLCLARMDGGNEDENS